MDIMFCLGALLTLVACVLPLAIFFFFVGFILNPGKVAKGLAGLAFPPLSFLGAIFGGAKEKEEDPMKALQQMMLLERMEDARAKREEREVREAEARAAADGVISEIERAEIEKERAEAVAARAEAERLRQELARLQAPPPETILPT